MSCASLNTVQIINSCFNLTHDVTWDFAPSLTFRNSSCTFQHDSEPALRTLFTTLLCCQLTSRVRSNLILHHLLILEERGDRATSACLTLLILGAALHCSICTSFCACSNAQQT